MQKNSEKEEFYDATLARRIEIFEELLEPEGLLDEEKRSVSVRASKSLQEDIAAAGEKVIKASKELSHAKNLKATIDTLIHEDRAVSGHIVDVDKIVANKAARTDAKEYKRNNYASASKQYAVAKQAKEVAAKRKAYDAAKKASIARNVAAKRQNNRVSKHSQNYGHER